MTVLRQRSAPSGRSIALRKGAIGLGCTAALLLSMCSGSWAQDAFALADSLRSGIPVKRDTGNEPGGDDSARWWLAALLIGGLAIWGCVVVRRSGQDGRRPDTWPTAWRRFADSGAQRGIHRVASMRLTPQHSLHVIEWNGQRLLLGCADKSIRLLRESAVDECLAASSGTNVAAGQETAEP